MSQTPDASSVALPDLRSFTDEELKEQMLALQQPAYRAGQLFTQLHRGVQPEEMTNLGRALLALLREHYRWPLPQIEKKLVSSLDGTVKYLFSLEDGACIESVVMQYEHGLTICISSQVGCRMGCRFCASTIGGKVRDLNASELLGQVLAAQKDLGRRIGNIVLMGIGEPLDNYDNVLRFLKLVSHPDGLNIGLRHISLSTCGIVPRILDLAREDLPITLSISLHAMDNATRDELMPVNRKYPVETLLDACKTYFETTNRRISFEYTLIAGKNDSPEQAEQLARLLNRHLRTRTQTMPIHVNLIPVNEVEETGFRHTGAAGVRRFAEVLEKNGIRATVRRKLGADINASCGQLRRAYNREKETLS